MRRSLIPVTIVAASLLLAIAVRPALAVTVDELVNLKAHGLGDDILVALVETDGSVFHLSAADIIAAKKRGLSDAVILAMIRTAQQPPAVADDSAAVPAMTPVPATPVMSMEPVAPVITVEPATPVMPVEPARPAPPAPVVIPFVVPVAIPVAVPVVVPVKLKEPAPVYWGWGGQRRPDSWVPASEVKPADPPVKTP